MTIDGSAVRIDLGRAPELRQKGASARLTDESHGVDLIVVHPLGGAPSSLSTAP